MRTFITFLLLSILCSSCSVLFDVERKVYTKKTPIYVDTSGLRTQLYLSEAPRALQQTGKIYIKDDYLFINEPGKGIHIVDNSKPDQPQMQAFIPVKGNFDMAIRCDVMYIDSYIDLVALDISDPENVHEINRIKDVFPHYNINEDGQLLLGHHTERIVETNIVPKEPTLNLGPNGISMGNSSPINFPATNQSSSTSSASNSNKQLRQNTSGSNNNTASNTNSSNNTTTNASHVPTNTQVPLATGSPQQSGEALSKKVESAGLGGSMAKFTIYQTNLYVVDDQYLTVFDVSDCAHPIQKGRVAVSLKDNKVETIFCANGHLFMGSMQGLFIYALNDNSLPTFVSKFRHATACDPVYVDGDVAYVTLRTGTRCTNGHNRLLVLDVSTLSSPQLIKSYAMQNPHGLAVKNNILYLCDGKGGLRVFDTKDKKAIRKNQLYRDFKLTTYDVIPHPNKDLLIVVGQEGLHQYDHSDPTNLRLLSKIEASPQTTDYVVVPTTE